MPDKISELLEETKIREGYQNIDGKPVTLEKLVRDEPGWACSRIRHMTAEVEMLREKLKAVATSSKLAGSCPPGMMFGHEDMCPPSITFSNSFSNGRICPVCRLCWQKWIES